MPISSLIVTARSGRCDEVAHALQGMAGVTVTDRRGDELVVLTETDSRTDDRAIWDRLETATEVKGVSLIYHNFEDLEGDPS